MFLFFLLFLGCLWLLFLPDSVAIVGFDCSHKGINVTTIAIDEVPSCNIPDRDIKPLSSEIQLVQLADYYPLHVYQCKIIIHRSIMSCGMHSHVSTTRGGLMEYIRSVSSSECIDIHRTRRTHVGSVLLDDLPLNASTTRSVVLAGSISYDGSCKGTPYSDVLGSWDNVVVQGFVKVTLNDYTADADTSGDTIRLRSGLMCKTSLTYCVDIENGFTTWDHDKFSSCDKRKHIVLFQGIAQKYIDHSATGNQDVTYIVESPERVFGLRIVKAYTSCMFEAYTTEHPKLIIIPKTTPSFFLEQDSLPTSSLDIMAYINTKFVYIDRLRETNDKELFAELSIQRCALERRTLQTMLAIATINPAEFAYTYMSSPGYTAVQLGEVVHVITCVAVPTTLRKTTKCYKEMPITYNNQSVFLTPRSRLIQTYGTEVDCDSMVNSQFKLDNDWYSVGKSIHLVPPPTILTPEPVATWKGTNFNHLATAGIYSYGESEQLRSRLMNPYEREAVNNILVRGVTGTDFERQGITLNGLIDDNMVDSMTEKIGRKIWGIFSVIGNISSGLLGLFFALRFIKFLADTLVHCRLLYEIYGFSVTLLAGVWDSVTTYLLHRKARQSYSTMPKQSNDNNSVLHEVDNHLINMPPSHSQANAPSYLFPEPGTNVGTHSASGIYPGLSASRVKPETASFSLP